MRKKFASLALLAAWLCANGALLDVVQVFAWGRMFAGNVATMDVTAALSATFDPARRCKICARVAQARDSAQKQAPATAGQPAEKLVLACEVPAKVIIAPDREKWPQGVDLAAPVRIDPVPVPPPRV